MRKICLLATLSTLLFCSQAFAYEDDNDCTKLSIQLVNTTHETCKLTHQNLMHGYMINTSHVPGYIPPGTTALPLDLMQGLLGPEIEFTYQCGKDKSITLYTKQNYCFLSAGDIIGRVLDRENMRADYVKKEGSFFWSQHGAISWSLSD